MHEESNWAARLAEWFWSGSAMRAQSAGLPPEAVRELDRRARISLEVARLTLEQSFRNGSAEAIACDLSRQAVYWALLGLRELRKARSAPAPPTIEFQDGLVRAVDESAKLPAPRVTLADLWAESETCLTSAGGRQGTAELLDTRIRDASFADLAELPPAERMRFLLSLRRLAGTLLREIDAANCGVDQIWMRRMIRVGGVLVVAALLGVASLLLSTFVDQRRDVARGRPWTASSKYSEGGCESPLQRCSGSPFFFFHTEEEHNPWLSVDLQSTQIVSAVRVINRPDCCSDRAVPLVVEVSTDQQHWQRVARRAEEFSDWRATFAPTPARWVRFRVSRRTCLHLREVRVLR
jgi:hypothetical protein